MKNKAMVKESKKPCMMESFGFKCICDEIGELRQDKCKPQKHEKIKT